MGIRLRTIFAFGVLLLAPAASGQGTFRVSVGSGGTQADQESDEPSLSADGRHAAFHSAATNLVAGDTNAQRDVFVHDRQTGVTERVNVSTAGAQADGPPDFFGNPSISPNGRYVVFASSATNLVAGDANGSSDVFLRDRQAGTTERVSLGAAGAEGDGDSFFPSISADGRFVAFTSDATNLVGGDLNGTLDIFVRDRQTGTTERVSVDSAGAEADGASDFGAISANGLVVAFGSSAANLVAGDSNGHYDVFVRERAGGVTQRVSVATSGAQGNSVCYPFPDLSADGRYVAFESAASNLVAGDTNGQYDIFLRDRQTSTTTRLSVGAGGAQGNGYSHFFSLSADGRFAAFHSAATNLVAGDTNGVVDVFVRDRVAGTTRRASVDSAGGQVAGSGGGFLSISPEARAVGFTSSATTLVAGDTNGEFDVFVREEPTSFTSLCDPGLAGVIGCPCANPPSGPGRGCDNSSATGGASLSAAGLASLASDGLVFTTSGERPTSLSIVAQWIGADPTGVVFGMGVRCTSGTFKRLYSRNAVGGSITAPNFGAGDLSVSAQSAAKGDTILAGQSRWYVVYYRDPNVLGGCPPTSNFNATQTGRVDWTL